MVDKLYQLYELTGEEEMGTKTANHHTGVSHMSHFVEPPYTSIYNVCNVT